MANQKSKRVSKLLFKASTPYLFTIIRMMRSHGRTLAMASIAGLFLLCAAACSQQRNAGSRAAATIPDYDVKVELENLSGEDKTNWPVIMTVVQVLGRNLPEGSVNLKGFRITDEKGKELKYTIENIPPENTPGNDEIIFIVPKIAKDAKMTLRVVNTLKETSSYKKKIDVVGSRYNLFRNPGFEAGTNESVDYWKGPCKVDPTVKRSGKASLLLEGSKRMEITYQPPIPAATAQPLQAAMPLHKGSRYYFSVWGKTDNVSRHGIHGSDPQGGTFRVAGFDNGFETMDENILKDPTALANVKIVDIAPQSGNRDWAKTRFGVRSVSDWGIQDLTVAAAGDTARFTIRFDQKVQFFMPKDKTVGKWWLDDILLIEQPRVTVRHDEVLKPYLTDGLFLFSTPINIETGSIFGQVNWGGYGKPYGTKPFPREKLTDLSRNGYKGQRVPFFFGLYHTRAVKDITVTVKDNILKGAGGQIALNEIEWTAGFVGEKRNDQMKPLAGPVSSDQPEGLPYFVASFLVPRDAKPGVYKGEMNIASEGKNLFTVPLTLCVQDLEFPVIRDVYITMIFQGNYVPFNDEGLTQYSKSGFTGVTRFGDFLNYTKQRNGDSYVDIADLEKKLEWLNSFGITAGIAPHSDFDLGPQWNGGRLFKASGGIPFDEGTKLKYQREVKRIEEFIKTRPDLPRIIYFDWDEPQPNGVWVPNTKSQAHGKPCEMMNWVNEVAPNAPHTLDAHLWVIDKVLPYYNMPDLDDPCDFACPEIYNYIHSQGKDFGFAAASSGGELARYQTGMMMATSGAKYMHTWHLSNGNDKLMDMIDGKVTRSIDMVGVGEGCDDYKIYYLLKSLIADAEKGTDVQKKATAREAADYLKSVFTVWNGDHINAPSKPYLGQAWTWGDENFYNRWQETMARFAAKLKGVDWIE